MTGVRPRDGARSAPLPAIRHLSETRSCMGEFGNSVLSSRPGAGRTSAPRLPGKRWNSRPRRRSSGGPSSALPLGIFAAANQGRLASTISSALGRPHRLFGAGLLARPRRPFSSSTSSSTGWAGPGRLDVFYDGVAPTVTGDHPGRQPPCRLRARSFGTAIAHLMLPGRAPRLISRSPISRA